MSRLFCFGLGYSAQALAESLAAEGWTIAGTTRDPRKRAALEDRGWRVFPFDRDRPLPPAALDGVTHLLSSVAPDALGDPVLDLFPSGFDADWVGYLSSTGVYGDHAGAWVDEAAALNPPTSDRAARRVAAEARWRDQNAHVFRLAGIYGPGRNALARARAGRARRIDKPGLCFSRVHVHDIVAVLRASIERPRPGAIYNVADTQPAPAHEVTAFACELLGLTPPPLEPFDEAQVSAGLAAFYRDDKKVRADLIQTELGVTLRYPTYADGLRALARPSSIP